MTDAPRRSGIAGARGRWAAGPGSHVARLAFACSAAVGAVIAIDPRAFVAVPALCGLAAVCVAAYRRPRGMLALASLLVLLASTKFSHRDETDSLTGVVDGAVLFELGTFAVVALIVTAVVAAPGFRARRLGVAEGALVAFVALAFASALWSEAPMLTLVRAGELAVLVALGLVAIRVLDVAGTMHAFGLTVVGYVLVCAAIAVAFPATRGADAVGAADDRFSWFEMHAIAAASFTSIAVLYLFGLAVFRPGGRTRRTGLPIVAALVPLCAVLVATNSRGPLFAVLGAIAAVVALRVLRPVGALAVAAAMSLAFATASVAGVTPASLLDAAARSNSAVSAVVLRGQTAQEFGSLTGRTALWADLVPLVLDRPVLGYGYQGARAPILRVRPWAGHAHNAVLQAGLDLGLVGAALFWGPFVWALCSRPRPRAPATAAAAWESASVFGVLVFVLINAMSDVSPAGGPAFQILLSVWAIMATERLAAREAPAAARLERAAPPVWGTRAASPFA